MKKNITVKAVCMLLLVLSALACNKISKAKSEELQKRAGDTIRGEYEIESCAWDGGAVDLDGDGTASSDIMSEWKGLRLSGSQPAGIKVFNPIMAFNDDVITSKILLALPFQKEKTRVDDESDFRGGTLDFLGSFTIDYNGTLEVAKEVKAISDEDIDKFEDSRKTGGNITLSLLGYASLSVRIASYTVFDRKEMRYVSSPLVLTFKRTKYI